MIPNPKILEFLDLLPREVALPVGWLRDHGLLTARGSDNTGQDLSVEEVAEIVDRKPATVRSWARGKRLQGYRLNGREWRFTREAVDAFRRDQGRVPITPQTSQPPGSSDLGAWRTAARGP